jgi:hypothetical protein
VLNIMEISNYFRIWNVKIIGKDLLKFVLLRRALGNLCIEREINENVAKNTIKRFI